MSELEIITGSSREEIQDLVTRSMDSLNKGIYDITMRFGKTRPVIKYISKYPAAKVLWVVPSRETRDKTLPKEFRDVGEESSLERVKIITWSMLPKIKGEYFDLVVLDEVHRITDKSITFFRSNTLGKVFGLTGTMPVKMDKILILGGLGLRKIVKISLEDGIELGAVAPFDIDIIRFVHNSSKYEAVSDLIEYRVENGLPVSKELRFQRMRILHAMPTRENLVKKLLNNLKDKRFLVFCSSIAQAKRLCKHTLHSKSKDFSGLNKFLAGEINHLGVIEMVTEGVTFTGLDGCVVVSPDSSSVKFLQKMGRTLLPREGYTSKIFVYCAKGTVQEGWLETALAGIDKNRITVKDV